MRKTQKIKKDKRKKGRMKRGGRREGTRGRGGGWEREAQGKREDTVSGQEHKEDKWKDNKE